MDVQVNMERVLALTQERLASVTQENIMLQAVVQDQMGQINSLKEVVDRFSENSQDKEDGNGSSEG